ncbi:MAG TPA: PilZ domain-containing protein [Geobacter sp.]|nr:PilZ domain-containing protein [Geobacter sp.]
MTEELAQYAEHFPEGGRVRVSVPLEDGGVFPEWGVVASLERDLLQVDLSRDALPEHALLEQGQTLDLGLSTKTGGMSCRGVLVGEELDGHRLVLRLIEDVLPFEPREFFRQDVYLPLDYRVPPTQFPDDARMRWEERRREIEFAAQSPEPGEPEELEDTREEIRARLEKRKAAPPIAANISGGGVRLNISEKLMPGMLVELSMYLPHPQRMLEIVGEVVEVAPLPDGVRFSTALQYRFIDEADRDRLIGFITTRQLLQLSQMAPRDNFEPPPPPSPWGRRLGVFLCIAFIAAVAAFLVHANIVKREAGEKWEVQRVFDEGIMKFLRQQR